MRCLHGIHPAYHKRTKSSFPTTHAKTWQRQRSMPLPLHFPVVQSGRITFPGRFPPSRQRKPLTAPNRVSISEGKLSCPTCANRCQIYGIGRAIREINAIFPPRVSGLSASCLDILAKNGILALRRAKRRNMERYVSIALLPVYDGHVHSAGDAGRHRAKLHGRPHT